LLFPFLLPTIWRASPTCKIALGVFLIGILSLFSYYYGGNFNEWDGPQTLLRCLPEFTLGTLLYAAFRSGIYAPILGSDAVSILILLTTLSILHFGGPDLAVVLLFAVLVLSVVVNTGKVAAIANRKPLIWLGDISYSLYLLHGFFQFAIAQLLIAFLEMERRWLMLARSYEFTQRLADFSNETKRRLDELPKHADP
jgi:peptidoglycan/LPS O-acetylase OafA/YrhL